MHWEGEGRLATALAALADQAGPWPGLPDHRSDRPIHVILAATAERFDSVTRGRVPSWSAGVAFPGTNTIVLRTSGDPRQVLRHELAHLALRSSVSRAPLWFDEGYAAYASGEWGRVDALRVNWALAVGEPPTLDRVNANLRSGASHAKAAYALATSAVQFLAGIDRQRGLEPLITNLRATRDFDRALRTTHGVALAQYEALWRKELSRRYGWLSFVTSVGAFWTLLSVVLFVLWIWRRGRDRERREALDEGWLVVPEEPGPSA